MSTQMSEMRNDESKPWWLYALIGLGVLLLLGVLLWALIDDDDDDDAATTDVVTTTVAADVTTTVVGDDEGATTTTSAAGAEGTGVITSIAAFLAADEAGDPVGREVRLTDVRVPAVIGDRAFVVGNGEQRILAALAPDVDTPERRVDVNPNDVVSFSGTVVEMPPNPAEAFRLVEPSELDRLATRDAYIRVTDITLP